MSYDTIIEMYEAHGKMPRAAEMAAMDDDCWTVAHYLASHNALPSWFDDWLLADADGLTVAHVAAAVKKFPVNFPHWKAATKCGTTVLHTACAHGQIDPMSKKQIDKICDLKNSDGKTPYDLYLEYGRNKIEGLRKILGSSKQG